MKRHVQQTGIRQWAGEDLLELQAEPLKALDRFFAEYGNCVIEGCYITDNGDSSYNITSGLVALSGLDVDGKETFKVVTFSGVDNVSLPIYMTLTYSVVERAYMDNKVKPIAYDYRAVVSAIKPEATSYLELSKAGGLRFVDVIQNSTHRFFTDVERKKLQGIEEGAIKYIHPDKHPATMITEDESHRFMMDVERTKLNGIEANANKYIHPDKHPATVITEDEAHRFMTDLERTKLTGIEVNANKYVHPANHFASMITEDESHRFMTDVERTKLNGIEAGAIKYVHPDKHPATVIAEDETHRFVSDSEKKVWDSKAPGGHKHNKSEITDFPSSMPASDVYGWAKAPNKPSYTAAEVGAALASHGHSAGEVSEDVNHRFVSDSEKSNWNSKAAGSHNHDTVYQPKGNYQPAGNYAPASHGHSAGEVSVDANRRFVTDAEKAEWNGKAAGGHNHDTVYQPKGNYQPAGNYAAASHGHSAGQVSEDASHRFVSDAEKAEWNGKASGSHNHSGVYQPAGNYQPAGDYAAGNHSHDGTYQPAGSYASSSHSHDGTYQPAGSYAAASHGHSAGQVSEETNRRWMTDAERSALSSLETYAKADFSNVTDKSMGQNGYYKLPDGLLIQWGYSSSSGRNKTIYLPASFYDANYSVMITMRRGINDTTNLTSDVWTQSNSSFLMFGLYHSTDANNGAYWGGFNWIAIGRWK